MRLLAVAFAALAATSAPAKPAARLLVTALDTRPGVAAETDVDLTLPSPASAVDVYVPAGYTLDLDARPGTVIGTARTTVASELVVAAPGVWKATGLEIGAAPTTDGGYRLEYRLARPAREIELDLERGLTNPPARVVVWRAFAGPVEARSLVGFPHRLTVRAGLRDGTLRASGRLVLAGEPRAGVSVHVAVAARGDFADGHDLGVAETRADGSYAFRSSLGTAGHRLTVIAYVNVYVGPGGETVAPPPAETRAVPG